MEKILENSSQVAFENEKLIANILHDIKSPLYSIKIGLKPHLNSELNIDIFETISNTLDYIENFLINYSFKSGKFEEKIESCDIQKIICEKVKEYKYIFLNKHINIDVLCTSKDCRTDNICIFLSSIIGNLVSNIAFHAKEKTDATIEIKKKENYIIAEFKNYFKENNDNFNLGLGFCENLAKCCKIELKYQKTQNEVRVYLKIPNLNY